MEIINVYYRICDGIYNIDIDDRKWRKYKENTKNDTGFIEGDLLN